LKPDVSPLRRRSNWVDRPAHLLAKDAGTLLVRMIEPNPITSHDWHVQPICQRSLRVVRLIGTPFGSRSGLASAPGLRPGLSSNLMRIAQFPRYHSGPRRFCANLLKLSKSGTQVKERIPLNHCG